MKVFRKAVSFSLLELSLGHPAFGQAVLVDGQCENATVDGRPGFVDFDENGVLGVWDNDTEEFLTTINPAQKPPSQQVLAGGAPTPQIRPHNRRRRHSPRQCLCRPGNRPLIWPMNSSRLTTPIRPRTCDR